MTRASKSALVLDGNEVKLRLEAERQTTGVPVHVDWVRFTTFLRNAPFVPTDRLFPRSDVRQLWHEDFPEKRLRAILEELPDSDFAASSQAWDLAETVAGLLGREFTVNPELRKGHDFYKFRWSIQRNGAECGWVGFLASGESPRQQAQSRTMHCNLYGAACTFAEAGWTDRLADYIDAVQGDLTRVDHALDFFDGLSGGMARVLDDYKAGLTDVGGRRLKCNMLGDWANGHARSFYIGSKEAGKQTNLYEKGDQLFGVESCSPWVRAELRWGDKLRELPTDMLRRPADFFAGASDWHATLLREAGAKAAPEAVATHGRLPLETVRAEVTRNVRWAFQTASATVAAAFEFLGDEFLELVTNKKRPGRLQRFSGAELRAAYRDAVGEFLTGGGTGPVPA